MRWRAWLGRLGQSRPGLDLRLAPAAFAAWAGAGAGVLLDLQWAAAAGAVGLAAVLAGAGRRRHAVVAAGICALAGLTVGTLSASVLAAGPVGHLARDGAVVRFQARLTSDVELLRPAGVRPAMARVRARTVWVEGRGQHIRAEVAMALVATGELASALHRSPAGEVVQATARLRVPDRGQPVAAEARVISEVSVVGPAGIAVRTVNRVRAGLRDAMNHSPQDQAGLVPSLVVGDTSGLDPDLTDDFRATGLTHLTAVSGTNLTLMLGFLINLCTLVRIRGWWMRVVQVLGVVGFVVLCRGEPSVLRAAAMGLVGLAALGAAGRGARGVRHLAVAVIVLCLLDPWLAVSWGFALSVSASAGILWWGGSWQQRMRTWSPGWFAEAVAIPLAAQIATQPLVSALSGQVSVVGVLANALVGPFVGPVTVLGLVAALLGFAPPLAGVVGWVAGWCVQPVIWVARAGAGLPAGTREVDPGAGVIAATAVVCLLLAGMAGWVLARRWASLLLVLALVAGSMWRPTTPGWPGTWSVLFCDVGQGDATLLRAGPDQAVLVDAGPEDGDVVGCLGAAGIRRIPLLVLTHYHDDHIAGLGSVLGAVRVDQLMVSPLASPSFAVDRVARLAASTGTAVRTASIGEALVIGEVQWLTVGVGSTGQGGGGEGESSGENNSSVIAVAASGGVRVLLAGDAEPLAQQRALRTGLGLGADVLKLPHHGSSRQDRGFFDESDAVVAIASAGRDNPYGHPASGILALATGLGMRTFRTDQHGGIAIGRRDTVLEVSTMR